MVYSGQRSLQYDRGRVCTLHYQGAQCAVKRGEVSRVAVPYFVHCPADEVIELTRAQQRSWRRGGVQRPLFAKEVATLPRMFLGGYGLLQDTSDSRMHLSTELMVSRTKSVGWVARYVLGLLVLTAGLVAA